MQEPGSGRRQLLSRLTDSYFKSQHATPKCRACLWNDMISRKSRWTRGQETCPLALSLSGSQWDFSDSDDLFRPCFSPLSNEGIGWDDVYPCPGAHHFRVHRRNSLLFQDRQMSVLKNNKNSCKKFILRKTLWSWKADSLVKERKREGGREGGRQDKMQYLRHTHTAGQKPLRRYWPRVSKQVISSLPRQRK